MDTEKIIKRIQRVSLSCALKTEEGIRYFHCGHEYVEIGGLKWATMNIGAEKPTDCGLYFQWGDTQGYTADQVGIDKGSKPFTWTDYNCGDGGSFRITKYNESDGKTVLDLEDDAVRTNWGGDWRMPTSRELQSLANAVNAAFTYNYQGSGVAGLVCTDKTDKSKVLFFPAAGVASYGSVGGVGKEGFVWSSSINDDYYYLNNARNFGFDSGITSFGFNSFRYYGFSVRGIFQ